MKTIKRISFIGVVVASLLLPFASANNGIQFYEFEFFDSRQYIACLGEEVDIYQHVVGAFQEFETPSGVYILHDNWRSTVTWIGVSTGWTWVGRNNSPFQVNIAQGEVAQFLFKGVQHPLTGDGPRFFYAAAFKVTMTPNGVVVVERELVEPFSDRVRCLGRN